MIVHHVSCTILHFFDLLQNDKFGVFEWGLDVWKCYGKMGFGGGFRMITFQDFQKAQDVTKFVAFAISMHKGEELYKTAKNADLYDRQRNVTINEYVQKMFTFTGTAVEDYTASNNKIASNFFHRLNTQRCTYSLGNGITLANDEDGQTKERLGVKFDTDLYRAGYYALIHGVSFGFWNNDRLFVFPVTEFVPIWDELDGTLKAGIRFWQISDDKPMVAVLYELDGYTRFTSYDDEKGQTALRVETEKRPYKIKVAYTEAGDEEVVGSENYSSLPIVPLWGSRLRQSTLIGMQQAIDSYDLIRSGFANDLTDCAEIYWMISNCGGMAEEDLQRFRDRMKLNHIVEVPEDAGAHVTPYTQDIPYNARNAYLEMIHDGIYEDFGGLDVHAVDASSTNDHLDAAYQPLDENADDFEYQIIEFVQQILSLLGIEDTPVFKRNRIVNTKEQVELVMMEAQYLDDETVLAKLPNVTPDEVQAILERKAAESFNRYQSISQDDEVDADDEEIEEEVVEE